MLDPRVEAIRQQYGLSKDDFWKLPQGRDVWLVKHAALEVVAAKAGIEFEEPQIIEADGGNGVAALYVRGHLDKRTVWSTGEANPKNCKTAYPWAIAEKRAIDRVVLKLIGLHGLVYSEEESDDFKPNASTTPNTVTGPALVPANQQPKSSASLKRDGEWNKVMEELQNDFVDCHSLASLHKLRVLYRQKAIESGWNKPFLEALKNEFDTMEDALKQTEVLQAGE